MSALKPLHAQIVGVIFPVFIMALVPFRQFIMPRIFKREHLRELDAAPYEEVGFLRDTTSEI